MSALTVLAGQLGHM